MSQGNSFPFYVEASQNEGDITYTEFSVCHIVGSKYLFVEYINNDSKTTLKMKLNECQAADSQRLECLYKHSIFTVPGCSFSRKHRKTTT